MAAMQMEVEAAEALQAAQQEELRESIVEAKLKLYRSHERLPA